MTLGSSANAMLTRQLLIELRETEDRMITASYALREDYWERFEIEQADIEFIYNFLLEHETPLTTEELVSALVAERINKEKLTLERQRIAGGDRYLPKDTYALNQKLAFPALGWQSGQVIAVRSGNNPDLGSFGVIRVHFDSGEEREFASGLEDHNLNTPAIGAIEGDDLDAEAVVKNHGSDLVLTLEEVLGSEPDFVRVAARWFPRALVVAVNVGHLNLAEAVLDMSGGGPIPTSNLVEQIDLSADVNPKLIEFSLDLALQEDPRFDEVGPAGEVFWFLKRLEPEEVLEPPVWLRYSGIEYDRTVLTPDMLALEKDLADELSPIKDIPPKDESAEVCLLYPHWRAGTLPISWRLRPIFPNAFEAPRIRFMLVDGETGRKFPAWVVQEKRYVFGLKEYYDHLGVTPGSLLRIQHGEQPGEVKIQASSRKSSREWIRTVLVGSDGGIVFAMLKQVINAEFDERMAIAVPDVEALDEIWQQTAHDRLPLERIVVNAMRELTKLNPQGHVHASELYAGINVVRRCPPGPILSMLTSRPWFVHVGDLHYRYNDSER